MVTIVEVYVGVRNPPEVRRVEILLDRFGVLGIDGEIARRGGGFRREFARNHGTGLLDALIAATAQVHRARLVTRNARHFPMLDDLLVPYQYDKVTRNVREAGRTEIAVISIKSRTPRGHKARSADRG